MTTQNFDLESR